MENPNILKGSSSNHTIGKSKIMIIASGQQITNKIHHRRKPIKDIDFIYSFVLNQQIDCQN
jgi:hypothetical protein